MSFSKKQRLYSLEAIRCLAFLGVFLSHSEITSKLFAGTGAWGVSVFLVLSGFLIAYNHYGSNEFVDYKFIDCLKFTFKKIKKLYPLVIITTLLMIPFNFMYYDRFQCVFVGFKTILNMLMIQEWFPFVKRSVNGVSWYMCVTFFSYIITPYIINRLNKRNNIKGNFYNILVLFIIQIVLSYLGSFLPTPYEHIIFEYDEYSWFIYKFPLTRIIDFIIGCNLGVIFLNKKDVNVLRCNIFEILALTMSFILSIFHGSMRFTTIFNGYELYLQKEFWYGPSVIFTINTCLLIYYFAIGKGFLSKLLTNKVTLFIAKLSPYAFLIHWVVIKYIGFFVNSILKNEFLSFHAYALNLTIGFILTIILSCLYQRLYKRITNKS